MNSVGAAAVEPPVPAPDSHPQPPSEPPRQDRSNKISPVRELKYHTILTKFYPISLDLLCVFFRLHVHTPTLAASVSLPTLGPPRTVARGERTEEEGGGSSGPSLPTDLKAADRLHRGSESLCVSDKCTLAGRLLHTGVYR